mgnify:FL=1
MRTILRRGGVYVIKTTLSTKEYRQEEEQEKQKKQEKIRGQGIIDKQRKHKHQLVFTRRDNEPKQQGSD